MFSYYLLNKEFTLRTDHSSLRWLDSFPDKANNVLARWLHYLEPFPPYMTILYGPGKLHGNADALSRRDTRSGPREDCPDHCHLFKSPSEKKARLLHAIQSRGQDSDHDLVPSLSNEEIRVSQKLDPEVCRFMELLHKHTLKPNTKSLREEHNKIKLKREKSHMMSKSCVLDGTNSEFEMKFYTILAKK